MNQSPMTLNPGAHLGPYEILAPLGAGSMGETYRARDSHGGRDVALKVLPADLAGDTARQARFEQETRLLAMLNHPRINDRHPRHRRSHGSVSCSRTPI